MFFYFFLSSYGLYRLADGPDKGRQFPGDGGDHGVLGFAPRQQAAVATVGQLTMVQAAADQTAQLRQVKLGRQIGDQVEVLAGLKPGDRIVLPE